ncbi:MAG: hypothetical protein GQ544_01370 [Candidatus Aminicenantes bacterium]|nr:hypothetical protein [Candidatus Aminicenantes bacterium]
MNTLSYIALILLSLAGYSGGATGKAGTFIELKPKIIDLVLVAVIWAGAICSRATQDLNKWLLILIWLILSIILGVLAVSLRRLPKNTDLNQKDLPKTPANIFKKMWQSWNEFSKRMGSFQSRILLSLFYFVFVSPFAIAAKMFSDPLNLKYRRHSSWWTPKNEPKNEVEQFRKQF